jgi:hypothetical protein
MTVENVKKAVLSLISDVIWGWSQEESIRSGGARPQNLGGIWGANSYFGGQDRIFKKVLLFAHAVFTGLLSPPPGDSPPLKRGRYS